MSARVDVLAVMDAEISALREGIARGDELIRADMPRRERVQVAEIRAALAARLDRAIEARAAIAAVIEDLALIQRRAAPHPLTDDADRKRDLYHCEAIAARALSRIGATN